MARLPPMTGVQALEWGRLPATGRLHGVAGAFHVAPMVDIGCLARCAGPTAYDCAECGADIACWVRCAGPTAAACVSECL